MDHSVVVGPSTLTGPDRFGAVSRQARRRYGASEATSRALDLRLALASLVDCVAALSGQAGWRRQRAMLPRRGVGFELAAAAGWMPVTAGGLAA